MNLKQYFSKGHIVDNLERKVGTGEGYSRFGYTYYQLSRTRSFKWFEEDQYVYAIHSRIGSKSIGEAKSESEFINVVFNYVSNILNTDK